MMINIHEHAPVKCNKTITIDANREVVWHVLTDINNWSKWNPIVTKAKLNSKLEENATFDWKSGGINIHSTFHTIESNCILGWTGKAMGVYAIHNWDLSEVNRQTRVRVEESMEGIFVKIFKNAFSISLERSMDKWLDSLKQECERRSLKVKE